MKLSLDLWKLYAEFSLGWSGISFALQKKPSHYVEGALTSRCADMKHVIFLDYDKIYRWIVEEELIHLQHYCSLTPWYLFKTYETEISGEKAGNYFAINLSKFPFRKVIMIQNKATIDYNFRDFIRRTYFKSWVLRTGRKGNRNKPEFIGVIGAEVNMDNEISTAHQALLLKHFPNLPNLNYLNHDLLPNIWETNYKTDSKVKKSGQSKR